MQLALLDARTAYQSSAKHKCRARRACTQGAATLASCVVATFALCAYVCIGVAHLASSPRARSCRPHAAVSGGQRRTRVREGVKEPQHRAGRRCGGRERPSEPLALRLKKNTQSA